MLLCFTLLTGLSYQAFSAFQGVPALCLRSADENMHDTTQENPCQRTGYDIAEKPDEPAGYPEKNTDTREVKCLDHKASRSIDLQGSHQSFV